MLDKRSIPVYMMGFHHGVQPVIYRTVQEQLERAGSDVVRKGLLEDVLEFQLDKLRQLCFEHKVIRISYQPSLQNYIDALESQIGAVH